MDIQKARELIGETNVKYIDDQIQRIIDDLKLLSRILIDQFYKMSPEERRKYSKSKKHLIQRSTF